MKLNDPRVREAFWQFILRTVPFFPANETLTLLRALKPEADIERQVNEALESLNKSAALVQRLEHDLTQRMEAVRKLQEEHKKFSELSQISKEQTAALSDLLNKVLQDSARKERAFAVLINLGVGIFIFVSGVVFANPIRRFLGDLFN